MTTFRQVKREAIPLLLGVAGGTGSGKTFSALLLARGMTGGQPFALIDTENGRAKHYADLFPEMRHADIAAPFRPEKYTDAILAGAKEFPVVVVDSMSHEWAGDGGMLDWHDELMGGDQRKNLSAWIEPKKAHKAMVTRLLQVGAHVILCFRAEPKVEAKKDSKGRIEIVPKPSLTGLDGWIPISEKMLPYELTASFLLMADAPGVPKPIKLQEQHKPFVPLDRPLDEKVGAALAEWARGSSGAVPSPTAAHPAEGAGGSGKEPAPAASDAPEPPSSPRGSDGPAPNGGSGPSLTTAQAKLLNVVVTDLREKRGKTTEDIYAEVAAVRKVDVDTMIELTPSARDEAGALHWSPLRETLTLDEASGLITRLKALQAEAVGAAA